MEILVQGESVDTDRNTQLLTVWQIDRETECQPDRQFAKEAASLSRSRFLSLPIPVVIHQDRSSIPLFSVQTEIMNQQYEEGKRRGNTDRMSRGVKADEMCDDQPGRGDGERKRYVKMRQFESEG